LCLNNKKKKKKKKHLDGTFWFHPLDTILNSLIPQVQATSFV
jgi:hypothetical protein